MVDLKKGALAGGEEGKTENNEERFVRSGFGILSVRVPARLSGETSFKLNGQSSFYAPLDGKSHHLLLLLLLWKDRADREKKKG